MIRIFDEGGINWSWYTKLEDHEDGTVTVLRHWREHKGDVLSADAQAATTHPEYYHSSIWTELRSDRTAVEYNLPDRGWCHIDNPTYIFGYGK